MRRLLFVAAVLAALFSGAWFLAASQLEARTEAALAELEADGWRVGYADLSTGGFPSRLALALSDLRLASPDGRLTWDAPLVRVFARVLRPNRVELELPREQAVTALGQQVYLRSDGLGASVTAGLSANLPLHRASVASGPLVAEAESGWRASLGRMSASVQRARQPAPETYDVEVDVGDLVLEGLPVTLSLLQLDAQVTLDAPIELRRATTPRLRNLVLRALRIAQGDVALTGVGELAPDAQGYLAGTVTLAVDDWRGLLDLLEEAGILVYDQRPFVEGALEELAQGGDRIEVPVTFADGQIAALGLVLLQAPRVL